MEVLWSIGQFVVGLVLILKGADWLTDGASAFARRLHVSTMIIGLTIVAFGTSAPELVVSALSSAEGHSDMAIGNIIGSNLFNSLAIMGVTALISRVKCTRNNIAYEIPMCILASGVLFVMANDTLINGADAGSNVISRSEGIILLCFFLIFLAYTFVSAMVGRNSAEAADETTADAPKEMPVWKSILLFVIGLACLVFGGDWLVDGASAIALQMGVSQSIVALTIVSAGTSFPELVTSIVAARKGDTDMAMGNVVGSNIFNVLMILGVSSVICPLGLGSIGLIDFAVLLISALALWSVSNFGKRKYTITRTEGAVLVLMMIAYYVYIVMQAL